MESEKDLRYVERTPRQTHFVPAFVTQAYGWGYQDGSNGTGRRGWMYFTLGDQRQAEYAAGYAAAQAIGSLFVLTLEDAQ